MKSTVLSCVWGGSKPRIVRVESTFTSGFPGIQVVGNAKQACREAKDRAKAALESLGFRLGQKRMLVNLSPASSPKASNHFDLPIALSLATLLREESPTQAPEKWLFAAELGIDGDLRPCRAVIPMAICAFQEKLEGIVLSREQMADTEVFKTALPFQNSLKFLHFSHLNDLLDWYFKGQKLPLPPNTDCIESLSSDTDSRDLDFDDMMLTEELEELAQISAIGRHHLLLRGTPGTGKSMFAQRLGCLIPTASPQHFPDILSIYSRIYENLPKPLMKGVIPFRSPHHSTSMAAFLGSELEPGELSLAHGGILFLDEFPEFRRDLIEALREPLEMGWIHISRAGGKISWHADFQLLAACNNCPCGWLGSKTQVCHCSYNRISSYWKKLSGPILDRIDIHYLMPERSQAQRQPSSKSASCFQTHKMQRKCEEVRLFQREHRGQLADFPNRLLPQRLLYETSGCSELELLNHIHYLESLSLSTRSINTVLRVARTLADFSFSEKIKDFHLHKAACLHHSMITKEFGGLY